MDIIYNTILSRRSIRQFTQEPIPSNLLHQMIDAARVAPSAANLQPLEYLIVTDKKICAEVFETIGWAGYLKPLWKPEENKRPTAYIIILVCKGQSKYAQWDIGLAAENIMLLAEAQGIGSCMLLKINRGQLRRILKIPESIQIDSVIALGYKGEQPVLEEMTNSIEYWKDDHDILHVPKRRLTDILHLNQY